MADPTYGGYSVKNRKLRQAISLSIDANELIDLQNLGMGTPAQSIVSPGLFGYEPDYRNPYRVFDPKLVKARRPAGRGRLSGRHRSRYGPPVGADLGQPVHHARGQADGGPGHPQISRLGLDVQSRSSAIPTFTDKLNRGQFEFADWGWGPDYPDVENFLFLLYGPNSQQKTGGPNMSGYSSPAYDRLFEQVRVMDDGPARLAIIRKMRAIAQEDCPIVPWLHSNSYTLLQPWIHNAKAHPIAPDTLKYWRVDAALRDKLQHKWNQPIYFPVIALAVLIVIGVLPAARVVNARANRRVRRHAPEQ